MSICDREVKYERKDSFRVSGADSKRKSKTCRYEYPHIFEIDDRKNARGLFHVKHCDIES